MIYLAAILDFLDGFSARLLNVSSPVGKELDSLADMVTFGVLPSVMVYNYLDRSMDNPYLPYVAFSMALFSALRLAKFNLDTRQTDAFMGLPTPANALFFSSLPIIANSEYAVWLGPYTVISLILVFSFLLVAELPLMALKFKRFHWKGNELKFVFLLFAALLLVVLHWIAVPLIIFLYIFMSLFLRKEG